MWTFANAANSAAATSGLMTTAATYTSRVVFTGTRKGKGMVGAALLDPAGAGATTGG
jgi:hypothetical protein